jgi:hypothetical protein
VPVTTTTIPRPASRVGANAVTTSKPSAPRRKAAPKADPQPRAYAPDSPTGKRVTAAFALKDEIDRLKALLAPHMAYFTAHCKKHNLSRLDVGRKQVQYVQRPPDKGGTEAGAGAEAGAGQEDREEYPHAVYFFEPQRESGAGGLRYVPPCVYYHRRW